MSRFANINPPVKQFEQAVAPLPVSPVTIFAFHHSVMMPIRAGL